MKSYSVWFTDESCWDLDRGHGCSGMTSDDERLSESETDSHSIGLTSEPSCEGDRGYECWSGSTTTGEETELRLGRVEDISTGVTDLLAELDSNSEKLLPVVLLKGPSISDGSDSRFVFDAR